VESKSYRALPLGAGWGTAFKSRRPDQIPQRPTAKNIVYTSLLESTWSPVLDARPDAREFSGP
jgi:hypothetical protein